MAISGFVFAASGGDQSAELPGWDALENLDESMARGAAIDLCLQDEFGFTWNFSTTNLGGGNFSMTGSLDGASSVAWSTSGTYSKSTRSINITAVNPAPDGCATVSGSFTYLGTLTGSSFSGTWTNDCLGSGSWTGVGSKGTCPPLRLAANSNANNPASVQWEAASIKLFPNPASHTVQVDLSAFAGQNVQVDLMDMSGRTLQILNIGEAPAVLRASVAAHAPGLYLVRVQHDNGVATMPLQIAR
jgi:hypothetical protein